MMKFFKNNALPNLLFIVLISIVQVIVFLVGVSFGGLGPAFLQVNFKVLLDMGEKQTYKMSNKDNIGYDYEVWRFVMPIFLHLNFRHIFGNMVSQLIFGIQLEAQIGKMTMICLYMGSGIGNSTGLKFIFRWHSV